MAELVNQYTKNPYDQNSPEWQLFEQEKIASMLATTYAREAEDAMRKSAASRDRAALYHETLRKLREAK